MSDKNISKFISGAVNEQDYLLAASFAHFDKNSNFWYILIVYMVEPVPDD